MGLSLAKFALVVILVPCLAAATGRTAKGSSKPLFTYFPSNMLCVDGPFVAMVRLRPQELVVLRIGPTGIDQPQTVRVNYDDVYGMNCTWGRVDLLVRATGSDHNTRLPFSITYDSVQQEQPRDVDYSTSGKGPTPPELEDFH